MTGAPSEFLHCFYMVILPDKSSTFFSPLPPINPGVIYCCIICAKGLELLHLVSQTNLNKYTHQYQQWQQGLSVTKCLLSCYRHINGKYLIILLNPDSGFIALTCVNRQVFLRNHKMKLMLYTVLSFLYVKMSLKNQFRFFIKFSYGFFSKRINAWQLQSHFVYLK